MEVKYLEEEMPFPVLHKSLYGLAAALHGEWTSRGRLEEGKGRTMDDFCVSRSRSGVYGKASNRVLGARLGTRRWSR